MKHTKLEKPIGGKFHRNEISILGAPCGIIQDLCIAICKSLEDRFKIGYVDADHGDEGTKLPFHTQYTDKISHHRLDFHDDHLLYNQRRHFGDTDFVLVNGNHFKSDQQIVIINRKKEASLNRKLDRLTNIKLIILDNDESEVYPFLKEAFPNITELPIVRISDIDKICYFLSEIVHNSTPILDGLVLAGGRSKRMGFDKGEISYYGVPQKEYMAKMIDEFCKDTYISLRNQEGGSSGFLVIADTFMGLGPYGGILSAFRENPNRAILTVPCDTPLLNKKTLKKLVESRNTSKVATCFRNEETGFPEPLITIWEPRAYPVLLHFLSLGYSCPRKVLINSDIEEITLDDPETISNANTPEDYEFVMSRIKATS